MLTRTPTTALLCCALCPVPLQVDEEGLLVLVRLLRVSQVRCCCCCCTQLHRCTAAGPAPACSLRSL